MADRNALTSSFGPATRKTIWYCLQDLALESIHCAPPPKAREKFDVYDAIVQPSLAHGESEESVLFAPKLIKQDKR